MFWEVESREKVREEYFPKEGMRERKKLRDSERRKYLERIERGK